MTDRTPSVDPEEWIAQLRGHERDLVFERFDHADAWRLGSAITERAIAAGHRVAIDIRRPGLILFRAALAGATEDQEHWVRRKAAVVLRLESSSALIAAEIASRGGDPFAVGWLDPREYALAGGSFPVRVRGVGVVAAVTVSGMTSAEDHALVVEVIADHLAASGG